MNEDLPRSRADYFKIVQTDPPALAVPAPDSPSAENTQPLALYWTGSLLFALLAVAPPGALLSLDLLPFCSPAFFLAIRWLGIRHDSLAGRHTGLVHGDFFSARGSSPRRALPGLPAERFALRSTLAVSSSAVGAPSPPFMQVRLDGAAGHCADLRCASSCACRI